MQSDTAGIRSNANSLSKVRNRNSDINNHVLNIKLKNYHISSIYFRVSQELFDGDTDNKDFLTTLLANNKHIDYQEFPGCGTTPLHESTEIKNEKASEGQWPWKASIYSKNEENEKFLCEATLITSKHVVLPAHCVSYRESDTPISVKNLIVYFVVGSAGVGVEKILLYPGYNTNSLLNDLAVVQLDKPITVDDHVRPICLGVGQKEHGILVGDAIKENIQKIQELVQTKVEIISRDECFTQQPDLKGLLTDGISCARFPEGKGLLYRVDHRFENILYIFLIQSSVEINRMGLLSVLIRYFSYFQKLNKFNNLEQ